MNPINPDNTTEQTQEFHKKIKSLLESMHKQANCEDWDEGRAQETMNWGGNLFEEYYG